MEGVEAAEGEFCVFAGLNGVGGDRRGGIAAGGLTGERWVVSPRGLSPGGAAGVSAG